MQTKQPIISLILCFFYLSVIPQTDDKYKLFEHIDYTFPYQISKPDQSWELPTRLVEISGLSYIDEDHLACVQDEKGNIYIFNLKIGEVDRKIDFAGAGDYEGVEVVGDDAWVLKSNGSLYHVIDFLSESGLTTKVYTTDLSRKNDAEGLGYDPANNNLLVACKGHPFVDKKEGKEFKSIYNFSLETLTLDLNPYFLIEMDSIKYYKHYNTMTQLGVELLAHIDHSKGDVSFQPSGIAVHPLSDNIYILGAVGDLLMVFSREGQMLAMLKLRSKYHPQPEGICFSPDGTMYISNEGDGGDGTILKFEAKK